MVAIVYLAMIPFSVLSYARVKRQRGASAPSSHRCLGRAAAGAGGAPRKAAEIAAQCALRVISRIAASATSRPKKKKIERE